MLMKRAFRWLFFTGIFIVVSVIAIDWWVSKTTHEQIYSSLNDVPHKRIGLLLGTSKYVFGTYENLFYKYRIDAVVELYIAGKIDFVLISGDNSRKDYSEPEMMQADLVARGIPADKIYLDYAGFRTLDSIVRCKLVFGESDILVISQKFHNERALYLANKNGLNAIAYNAKDVPDNYSAKTLIREKFARTKMILDLLFGEEPKYLGERVFIH
jgi:SanA protein